MGSKNRVISGFAHPYHKPAKILFSFATLYLQIILAMNQLVNMITITYLILYGNSLISKYNGQNAKPEDLSTGNPSVLKIAVMLDGESVYFFSISC